MWRVFVTRHTRWKDIYTKIKTHHPGTEWWGCKGTNMRSLLGSSWNIRTCCRYWILAIFQKSWNSWISWNSWFLKIAKFFNIDIFTCHGFFIKTMSPSRPFSRPALSGTRPVGNADPDQFPGRIFQSRPCFCDKSEILRKMWKIHKSVKIAKIAVCDNFGMILTYGFMVYIAHFTVIYHICIQSQIWHVIFVIS